MGKSKAVDLFTVSKEDNLYAVIVDMDDISYQIIYCRRKKNKIPFYNPSLELSLEIGEYIIMETQVLTGGYGIKFHFPILFIIDNMTVI